MITFPPEFHGMVSALWTVYQPAILVWMALMFCVVLVIAFGIVGWNIVRSIWNK